MQRRPADVGQRARAEPRAGGRQIRDAHLTVGRARAQDWPPGHTGYQWEGIQGYVVQAELLRRAGYPAWQVQDRAPLRTVEFMHHLAFVDPGDRSWWDKAAWTVALTNAAYGTGLPAGPADGGKNMAWTDWTHQQTRRGLPAP